jgi:phosphatidylserine/phosphatidylglycerophosphate/cardiolipin synthase-like enzyme
MGLRAVIEQIGHLFTAPPTEQAWWARGDTPMRVAETLVPLVDGRAAMLAMCLAFLTAQECIWLAGWNLQAGLELVRGPYQQAGEDRTPAQKALLELLHTAGLDEEALALWQQGQLRVEEVLGFAARRGVDVRVLLWDSWSLSRLLHLVNSPPHQKHLLKVEGVQCRLDKSSRSLFHVAQTLHQKFSVIDGTTARERPRDRVMRYRPIYVHAKVGVVDDRWATVGSANLNSRSMSHDAELNLAVLDQAFARGLRLSLWAEHLGLLDQAQTGWPAPATLPLPKPMMRPKALRGILAPVDQRSGEVSLLLHPLGPLLLGLVAVGLVAYGIYSFVEARYRRLGQG